MTFKFLVLQVSCGLRVGGSFDHASDSDGLGAGPRWCFFRDAHVSAAGPVTCCATRELGASAAGRFVARRIIISGMADAAAQPEIIGTRTRKLDAAAAAAGACQCRGVTVPQHVQV
jgi:hypothetical protein